ncbi:periphilin-1 isoform X7 [Gasterosteus aculeatus]
MTYRRERNIREVYEDRFLPERPGPYPRAVGTAERRGPFGRPEDDYGRGGYEYEAGPRFFPNGGGPRNYHEDQRGYHGDNVHFPAERRAVPPSRREEYPYRVPREDPHAGRPLEFGARAPPPHSVRTQGIYPAARSLPESGEDTLVQAILNLDRGEDRDQYRRKAVPFPPLRERSPVRRDAPRSPHSRSGSSVSSRGYSPDRAKTLPFPLQQSKGGEPSSRRRKGGASDGSSRRGEPEIVPGRQRSRATSLGHHSQSEGDREGVPARLRDIWHGGEDAGGQGPQPGEAAASSPEGEPGGDPRTLPGGTEPLHRRAGRGGPAVGTFRL